ncbi:hypothetical protein D3C72_1517060 [compost metagenome]
MLDSVWSLNERIFGGPSIKIVGLKPLMIMPPEAPDVRTICASVIIPLKTNGESVIMLVGLMLILTDCPTYFCALSIAWLTNSLGSGCKIEKRWCECTFWLMTSFENRVRFSPAISILICVLIGMALGFKS